MALTGSGDILGLALQAARAAAVAAFMVGKEGRELEPGERQALFDEVAKAEGRAIIAHIVTFGVASVVGAGPGFPGSIT